MDEGTVELPNPDVAGARHAREANKVRIPLPRFINVVTDDAEAEEAIEYLKDRLKEAESLVLGLSNLYVRGSTMLTDIILSGKVTSIRAVSHDRHDIVRNCAEVVDKFLNPERKTVVLLNKPEPESTD